MPALLLRDAVAPPPAAPGGQEIKYKLAESRDERTAAFRLVYQAYIRAGLIESNPSAMRVTPYQLQPGSAILIATLRDEVISTVSLIADGPLGLPMESIYREEVAHLRESGHYFGEVSALADRRQQMSRTLPVFVKLMRLMVQYAQGQGIGRLLVAVHPRHGRFYQRFLSFQELADERSYPQVRNRPAVALYLDFARIARERPPNYELFFGKPLAAEQLLPRPMPVEDAEHFAAAAAFGTQFTLTGPAQQGGD